MGKGMRTFSWLLLCMWLGCGSDGESAGSETGVSSDAETSGATTTANTAAVDSAGAAKSDAPVLASAKPAAASSMGTAARAAGMTGAPGLATAPTTAAAPAGAAPAAPASTPSGASAPASSGAAGSSAPSSDGDSESEEPASDPAPSKPGTNQMVQASVLTAGTTDDNRNFERFTKYRKKLKDQQLSGMLPSTDEEHISAQKDFAQPAPREKLDVALVIDTTGSMGDEIRYLQSEFLALSSAIEEKYPNAEQRWALVAYRDMGDDYVTRHFDFRDDVTEFRDRLGEQSAGGGGDFPEAPEAALETMAQLAWRSEDKVARLAFWVADAPHHDNNAQKMLDAIRGARELGVHLYPVASSGVDELTEVSMRSAAQLTGGRYLFLTDDSGVGGSHKEPTIPCYFVTKLDKAILRMVNIEMSGVYAEPAEDDIIRTGGSPKDGSCKLDSGEVVQAY